ncbi:MAG TPA: helix-turn-helix domain-containing protein [Actinomycetota bacterium]|nr:helix-turn-helix domain-containing protein [Actinomycetota bacterium]
MAAEGQVKTQVTSFLFLEAGSVPERWADRAITGTLVPLTPQEANDVLAEGRVEPDELGADGDFVRLVARGLSAEVIARRLGLAPRSVYRRLARLRDALQVRSTAELASELARRGYGVTDPPARVRGNEPRGVEISEKPREV